MGEARRQRSSSDGSDRSTVPPAAGSTTPAADGGVDPTPALRRFPGFTVARRGARAVLAVAGELDGHGAPRFLARVTALVDQGARRVVVDLGGGEVVDDAGLAALVGAHEYLEQHGGELLLRSPRYRTLHALDHAGLSDVLPVC